MPLAKRREKNRTMLVLAAMTLLVCLSCFSYVQAGETEERNPAWGEPLFSGNEYTELLPIGSIVLLKNSEARLMIMGYLQALDGGEDARMYDYCGCLFPSGYESADQVYLFDRDQIESIYYLGYQDEEEEGFLQRVKDYFNAL